MFFHGQSEGDGDENQRGKKKAPESGAFTMTAGLIHKFQTDEPFEVEGFGTFDARTGGVEGLAVRRVALFENVVHDEAVFLVAVEFTRGGVERSAVLTDFGKGDEMVLAVIDGHPGVDLDVLDGLNGEVDGPADGGEPFIIEEPVFHDFEPLGAIGHVGDVRGTCVGPFFGDPSASLAELTGHALVARARAKRVGQLAIGTPLADVLEVTTQIDFDVALEFGVDALVGDKLDASFS